MALLAGRLVLAVVFGLAAVAKLADRAGGRRALVEFGIPERFAAPGVWLLPFAELGAAAALLARPLARLGAAGALALLVVFSVAVAVNLAAGRKTDCHCFGRLHSSPIGLATLARNGLLGALAFVVMVDGPGTGMGAAAALAAGLALAAMVAVGQIQRRIQRVAPAPRRDIHSAPDVTDVTAVSRRHALALLAMTVVGAAFSLRTPQATACGAECRSSADCPGTCTDCKKRPGMMTGHCH
jgi:hypothetical protein